MNDRQPQYSSDLAGGRYANGASVVSRAQVRVALARLHALVASLLTGAKGSVSLEQRAILEAAEAERARLESLLSAIGVLAAVSPPALSGVFEAQSRRNGPPPARSDAAREESAARDYEAAGTQRPPFSILLADENPAEVAMLNALLGEKHKVTLVQDGAEALGLMTRRSFDLAIIDVDLPVVNGFRIVETLRERDAERSPAFILLSAQTSSHAKVHGLTLGAADFITKPFDTSELSARIERTLVAVDREAGLRADALTDPLTGLANYRSLLQGLDRELERARRFRHAVALLTLDLDNLKGINDEHGHAAGNEAIELVGRELKGIVRRYETVARQGGDEFAVLLPSTGSAEAARLAERLRTRVAALQCRGIPLSISVGVASQEPGQSLTARELMEQSDAALYQAKRAGRNRVGIAAFGPTRGDVQQERSRMQGDVQQERSRELPNAPGRAP